MSWIGKLIHLPRRVLRHLQARRFYGQFPNISRGASVGSNGFGKDCILEGDERLSIGSESFVGAGSELFAYEKHFDRVLNGTITMGNHVRITARCRITCAHSVEIGDDTLMAPDVFISDHNHGMDPEAPGGYSPQPLIIRSVVIGKGVWLGQRVCVLPGAEIGDHSIIGANSVVTGRIPPYSIAVGAPARVIKKWNFEEKRWDHV